MTPHEHALSILSSCFPQARLTPDALVSKHQGRFANAHVFHYRDENYDLIIKDFFHCPCAIRATLGRLGAYREFVALSKLQGLPGISPSVYRLSPIAIAYTHISGKTLSDLKGKTLPPAFFHALETLVTRIHERGFVHLDMRNMGNILCGDNGSPYLIDFQSAISLQNLPGPLRDLLCATDRSGIYKAWSRYCGEPLPSDKKQFLDNFNRLRKFWVLRGYPISHFWRRLRKRKAANPPA
ncbi:MAG: hypothetical protein LBV54_08600 [Puniceicoccales bacterium]|jgi:RIO-like serine/threonine protein kinase|nr:hypothetical protein [Puniceicoccales bacterium]